MTFSKKNLFEAILFFLLTGIISFFFFSERITLFPSFIHAWTQSDRFALALGFLNNGFDFFHPQTFNLATANGITQVDFPVHEFIVALIMKVSGIHDPVVFRCYTLIYGLAGLYYLFLLTRLSGGSLVHGFFVSVFIMTCPVFAYYLDGFLPSIPSFSNAIIGYYFYFRYKKLLLRGDFIAAIFFFTLAALARTPFVIFLFAVFCEQVLNFLQIRKINKRELLQMLGGFVVIESYFFYNLHLAKQYGSQFLTYLLPAKSFTEAKELFFRVVDQWKYDYFSMIHYLVLLLLSLLIIIPFGRSMKSPGNKAIAIQSLLTFCGATIYFLLMMTQFPEHDYYFIDSYYPVVALTMVWLVTKLQPSAIVPRIIFVSSASGLMLLFCFDSAKSLGERYTVHEWDRTEITRQNFTGAKEFLDSTGISKDAKMLVLDAYTTNTPLILMNRKGYTLLWTTKENTDSYLKKDFDYVVMQDCFLVSDVVHFDPGIVKDLEKISDNGKISLYKKVKNENRSLEDFLGMKEEFRLFSYKNDFENDSLVNASGQFKKSGKNKFAGNSSCFVDSSDEFVPTFKLQKKQTAFMKSTKIFLRTMMFREDVGKDVDVVVSLSHGDENYFYRNFNIAQYIGKVTGWQEIMFQFVLPEIKSGEDKLSVYFWNKNKSRYYLDDFQLIVYN